MKVKIRENHWLPKKLGVIAITIYPRIYMSISYAQAMKDDTLNHEFIHVAQVRTAGWIRFYATYILNAMKYTYYEIPEEIEAYDKQASTPYPINVKLVNGVLQET